MNWVLAVPTCVAGAVFLFALWLVCLSDELKDESDTKGWTLLDAWLVIAMTAVTWLFVFGVCDALKDIIEKEFQ